METKYWEIKHNIGFYNKVISTLKRKLGKNGNEGLSYEFWFDDFESKSYSKKIRMIFTDDRITLDEKQELLENILNIKDMIIKEERIAKVSFNKSGGTAKGNAITNRVTIPRSWIKQLEITEDDREVKLILDNDKIVIEKLK